MCRVVDPAQLSPVPDNFREEEPDPEPDPTGSHQKTGSGSELSKKKESGSYLTLKPGPDPTKSPGSVSHFCHIDKYRINQKDYLKKWMITYPIGATAYRKCRISGPHLQSTFYAPDNSYSRSGFNISRSGLDRLYWTLGIPI